MAKASKPKRIKNPNPTPRHVPDAISRGKVEVLSLCGIKQDVIAGIIGISDVTLRKLYKEELEYGSTKIIIAAANQLIRHGMGDGPQAVAALKYLLDRRGGKAWAQDQVNVEADGTGGKVVVNIVRQGED